MTESTPHAPAPAPALDEVMLAMDVVDTLRHEQQLVAAELDDEQREAELIARVRSIYDSQGIEVTEAVVAEGVRALRDGRFRYTPPARTFAVRLASLYVDRRKWTLRGAIVALVAAAIWTIVALPASYRRQALVDTFARQLTTQRGRALDLQRDTDLAAGDLAAARGENDAAVARLLEDAAIALQRCRERIQAVLADLDAVPDPSAYPDRRAELDVSAHSREDLIAGTAADLATARGLLTVVQTLRGIDLRLAAAASRLGDATPTPAEQAMIDAARAEVEAAKKRGDGPGSERALAAFDRTITEVLQAQTERRSVAAGLAAAAGALGGVDVEPDAKAELAELRTGAEASLTAGDTARAGELLRQLQALVRDLDLVYELRIVSRPGEPSAVWRHPDGDPRGRSFYLIVEATGPGGRPVALPVRSVETQRTDRVSKFGVRVPESVYERVKADKLDNGTVDDAVLGTKRRGRRDVEYRMEVTGGAITQW